MSKTRTPKTAKRSTPRTRKTASAAFAPMPEPLPCDEWRDDTIFTDWLDNLKRNLSALGAMNVPLFISGKVDVFAKYLRAIPRSARQYHRCNECRHFINTYGRLLYVDLQGHLCSPFWDPDFAPDFYKPAAKAMREAVIDAGIVSPFYTTECQWGTRTTGPWTHFAVTPPSEYVERYNPIKSPSQKMAEKVEDYKNVDRALHEFDHKTLTLAVELLRSETLYRSEKVLAPAEWLLDLANERRSERRTFANRLWAEVAIAPAGFCHPRASMIGSLLEDLGKMSLAEAKRAFAKKMNPLQYMRPTAAPAAQTIDRAEDLVEKMGIAKSLERRFATPADIPDRVKMWVPAMPRFADEPHGVFASLRAKHPSGPAISDDTMTWSKFERTVLPDSARIEVLVPHSGHFHMLCTAAHDDAPNILRWGNTFNWYVWHSGSMASSHNLRSGEWRDIYAVTTLPSQWNDAAPGQRDLRLFFISGATETQGNGGSALFPEVLRGDLHEVRSVIERYSASHNMTRISNAAVALPLGDKCPITIRVTLRSGVVRKITLDRME